MPRTARQVERECFILKRMGLCLYRVYVCDFLIDDANKFQRVTTAQERE